VRSLVARRRLAAGALVLAVAAMLAIGAAYAYARSQRDTVALGIHVGTIDLGGLSAGAARLKLEHAYRPLEHSLLIRYGGGRLVLTTREARVSVNTEALVAQALDLSGRAWFVPRAWRELTGGRLEANLRPSTPEFVPHAPRQRGQRAALLLRVRARRQRRSSSYFQQKATVVRVGSRTLRVRKTMSPLESRGPTGPIQPFR
jgi:hypothetical protein